jgi:hypothetical protein
MTFIDMTLWKLKKFLLHYKINTSKYPKAILDKEWSDSGTKWYNFMTANQMRDYYHTDELHDKLITEICKAYPNIKNLRIDVWNWGGFYYVGRDYNFEMKIKLNIYWDDGIVNGIMYKLLKPICDDHLNSVPYYENEHWQGVQTAKIELNVYRQYSHEVLLTRAKVYADKALNGIPVTINNIGMLKVGDVTLRELVINDLWNTELE